MSVEALLLAERSVPRYTSYPTAPHFTPDVRAADYRDWLAQLPADASLSLYLHVPFCRELCLYCGCHTKAVRKQGPVDNYAAALEAEIALLGRRLDGRPMAQIHWGGGTPSLLGPERLRAITSKLSAYFDVSAIREHAIELDPRYVTPALVDCLARMGVNRASLGVQDLSPHVQRAIGRVQPYDSIAQAVELLRGVGITQINCDVMFGLPRQTADDVRHTAEQVCALRPGRIALFGYAHVPWFRKQQTQIDASQLPGAKARLEQMETARAAFISAGYRAIGLDHFSLPDDSLAKALEAGTLRRNFQGYTADDADALIGLGASSIGRLPKGYVQNAPDVAGYCRAVHSGAFATVRGVALSPDDRTRARIIERLMCDLHINLRDDPGLVSGLDFAAEIESLAPYAADGLVEVDGTSISVTERGRPFLRLIAAVFDSYLAQSTGKHSRAV